MTSMVWKFSVVGLVCSVIFLLAVPPARAQHGDYILGSVGLNRINIVLEEAPSMNKTSVRRTGARGVICNTILMLGIALGVAPEVFAWGRLFGGGFRGGGFGGEGVGDGFNQGGGYGGMGGGGYPGGGAGRMFIYPSRGQSPQQEHSDKEQCYTWAAQQSGFNPASPQILGGPPPQSGPPQGGLLRGGAGGAAMGAIGGAIGGNAGEGAAIGAAVGGLFGGMRRRRWEEQQQFQQSAYLQQQQNVLNQGSASFNQAFAVCMTGRGYTVGG
jgi:hypothetical protein